MRGERGIGAPELRLRQGESLPEGVVVRALTPNRDARGVFTEVHRDEWGLDCKPVQWNLVRSEAGVLRGVHVHRRHQDQIVLVEGTMLLGLHDIRPHSPTRGASAMITLDEERPVAVVVPVGVAHGFYFPDASVHIYAVSEYWNAEDELGCRFDNPKLALNWPTRSPLLSARDADAGSYDDMVAAFVGS